MYKLSTFLAEGDHGYAAIPLHGPADSTFEKTAAGSLLPEVLSYIAELKPRPGSQYVLVNAMGAGEYYGSNINGDHFEEAGLIHAPPGWTGNPLVDKALGRKWTYGFPTFYNAYPYAHHRNKDPSRAYGEVELAVWHDGMKRVELVCRVDYDKCVKFGGVNVWDKLKAGQYPDVSMGSKVCYDLSSITLDKELYHQAMATFDPKKHAYPGLAVVEFHKKLRAKNGVGIPGLSITRNDYDEWTKNHMNRILPDGRKVFVYNPYPRFFDISFVFIGADRTAKTMVLIVRHGDSRYVPSAEAGEKVASANNNNDALQEKVAAVDDTRDFLSKIQSDAKKKGLNIFAVAGNPEGSEGASIYHNTSARDSGNAIYRARQSHMRWEKKHGFDPQHDWSKSAEYVLKSAFAFKGAEDKRGEIEKEIPADKAVPLLSKNDKDLPEWAIKALSSVPEEKALGTTASMGIVLKPKEFQRITLIRLGKKDMADELAAANKVFPHVEEEEPKELGSGDFIPALARKLLSLLGGRSALGPYVEKRIIIQSKNDDEPPTSHNSPDLRKIGSAYNGYRRALMDMVATAQDFLPKAAPADEEISKLASAPIEQVFTKLSFEYLRSAFPAPFAVSHEGVVQPTTTSVASVQRGSPSKNTWM